MLELLRRVVRGLAAMAPVSRYVVEGSSMLPTFAPGDRIVVSRAAYLWRSPVKGDLIVCKHPFDLERPLLKRVAAVSGESVVIGTRNYRLGAGEWYVLGDNADGSSDSRSFGPVERRQIVGKVWFRY